MGVFDKFLSAIKLNDDFDDEFLDDEMDGDEEDDFLEDEIESRPHKSFLSKFSKKKESDEELDEFDDFDEKPEPKEPKSTPEIKPAPVKAAKTVSSSAKITPMRSSRRAGQPQSVSVCVIKPTSMEDTRSIADTLLSSSTVILNLEGIDVDLAQRVIDFSSGACYSLNGTLQKISSYIFVLAPYNVDITGDIQNVIGESIPSVRAGY